MIDLSTAPGKGLELAAQRLSDQPAFGREDDFRNPLIRNAILFGVGLEDVSIEHSRPCIRLFFIGA